MLLPDDAAVHRIGGADVPHLRLSPADLTAVPPGLSVLLGGTPHMATMTDTTVYQLSDALGRDLGRVVIDGVEGGWMQGTFTPGPEYSAVEPLFTHFAQLVEGQALSLTDQAQEAINRLGIVLRSPGGAFRAENAQIDSENGFACRLPTAGMNGQHAG